MSTYTPLNKESLDWTLPTAESFKECSQLATGDRRCKEQTWAVQLGGLKKIKTDAKLNLGGTYKVI